MTLPKTIYVALSQFCEHGERPRRILLDAGFRVIENKTGRRLTPKEMENSLREADAVLAGVEPYPQLLLEKLPNLRVISRCGIGTDAIDLEAAKRLNIQICVTPDEVVEPVAQLTLGMMFALIRNFSQHISNFKKGEWKKISGYLVSELTIGLVGFGRIAQKVEEYLKSFAPRVLICDPFVSEKQIPASIQRVDLAELLKKSDIVSLHASRSPEEGFLLREQEMALMKNGGMLINTARGYLVDHNALYDALQSGHLAGAALDVFAVEPYHGNLTALPNVMCTPHVATLTRASRIAMEEKCAQNVANFFNRQHNAPLRGK